MKDYDDCDSPGATHYLQACPCQMAHYDWLVRVEARARDLWLAVLQEPGPKKQQTLQALNQLQRALLREDGGE